MWGSMSAAGVGELVFIDEIMKKMKYMNILNENLKKRAEELNLPSWLTFHHNKYPKNSAHVIRTYK